VKLLLSSYSFGAGRGSEPGVGWNVATGMAMRGHEVTVLTTSEFHHLNFADGVERPFRVLERDFGIRVFNSARSYNYWQKRICEVIRKLCHDEQFDLIHHVTFNQYRGIRDVFAVNIPYVIGPIGGAEVVAGRFLFDMPLKFRLKEILRYVPYDICSLGARVRHTSAKGIVLASTPQTYERLKKYARIDSVELVPIIAVNKSEILSTPPRPANEPYILFDGGTRHDKGLKLMIRALALLWKRGIHIKLKIAAVAENCRASVCSYAQSKGVPNEALELMPFMRRDELMQIKAGASLFVVTSYRDSGCMTLLEAVALGVRSLCLDTPGQFWLPSQYAIKLPITSDMEQRFALAIHSALTEPENSKEYHTARAEWLNRNMSWDARMSMLEEYYHKAIELNN